MSEFLHKKVRIEDNGLPSKGGVIADNKITDGITAPAAAGALGEPHQGGGAEASFATAADTRKASPAPALRAAVGPGA